MPVPHGKAGVRMELHKFRQGSLHSGSSRGPIVTDRKQAIAIALHQAGLSRGRKRTTLRQAQTAARRR